MQRARYKTLCISYFCICFLIYISSSHTKLKFLIYTVQECLARHDVFGEKYIGRRKPHITSENEYCVTDCRGYRNIGVICETNLNRIVRCDVPFCGKNILVASLCFATETNLDYRMNNHL